LRFEHRFSVQDVLGFNHHTVFDDQIDVVIADVGTAILKRNLAFVLVLLSSTGV
jgi:hypothetical protein